MALASEIESKSGASKTRKEMPVELNIAIAVFSRQNWFCLPDGAALYSCVLDDFSFHSDQSDLGNLYTHVLE